MIANQPGEPTSRVDDALLRCVAAVGDPQEIEDRSKHRRDLAERCRRPTLSAVVYCCGLWVHAPIA